MEFDFAAFCSFQEMAAFDIPAMLQYALSVSGQTELFYIGHSQGTLVGFEAFSSIPEIAKKVKLFIALAPIYYLNHTAEIAIDLAFTLYPIEVWAVVQTGPHYVGYKPVTPGEGNPW